MGNSALVEGRDLASPTKLEEVALRSNDGGGVGRKEYWKRKPGTALPEPHSAHTPSDLTSFGHLPQLRGGG
ncbi:hypothetical protein GCM10007874_13740 [Labrys miyagiensis]|uniref:Uncharacterized protein n=1 Tax=Labrys miyagiensis TaxID=346912 RepID=A0ABQ6CJB6_9HYPH|nr:hypothetical protein GCM10007874_13740 [Labrys miyagiensis]